MSQLQVFYRFLIFLIMDKIFNQELIAFQSVDQEGDVWCNEALLFENEDEVSAFFNNPEKVIEVLGLEIDEDCGETMDSFIKIFMCGETIHAVRIILEYCGVMWIKRMSKGFLIRSH